MINVKLGIKLEPGMEVEFKNIKKCMACNSLDINEVQAKDTNVDFWGHFCHSCGAFYTLFPYEDENKSYIMHWKISKVQRQPRNINKMGIFSNVK